MRKFNQKGFSAVETVLVLVIIAIVAGVVWYIFEAKSNTDTTYGNTANTQTVIPPAKKSTSSSSNSAASQIVQTKTDSKLGQYLADASGKALYTYSSDTTGVSNCTGSCLADWPAYKATSSSASLPSNVTVINRSDGGTQYAYKGMPLYTFVGDSSGQVSGDGVGGFHVAKP